MLKIDNPTPRPVHAALALDTELGSGCEKTLDHQHLKISGGQSYEASFRLKRFSGTDVITSLPKVAFTPELVGQNAKQ